MGTILTAEHFGDGLTEPGRQLFDRARHLVPDVARQEHAAGSPDVEEVQVYWNRICREELENTWAARGAPT